MVKSGGPWSRPDSVICSEGGLLTHRALHAVPLECGSGAVFRQAQILTSPKGSWLRCACMLVPNISAPSLLRGWRLLERLECTCLRFGPVCLPFWCCTGWGLSRGKGEGEL